MQIKFYSIICFSLLVQLSVEVFRPARSNQETLLQTHLQAAGSAEDVIISVRDMWKSIPINKKTQERSFHRPPTGCNNCLRPPIENTPGVGEGVIMCYYWSDTYQKLLNYSYYLEPQKQCARDIEASKVCVPERVADSPSAIFGNSHTFVREGSFFWRNPDSVDFHRMQGYMIHPVEGGKKTVQFFISFDIDNDQNACPRPFSEPQTVEWVVFHSFSLIDANLRNNYEVLDSGKFVISNGVIDGKSSSDDLLYVGNFTGDQVIAVWINVEFDTQTNGVDGMIGLKDNSQYEFIGECTRTCLHCKKSDGCLDKKQCRCECPEPWRGKNCSECSRSCVHGELTDSCSCSCEGLWGGENCDECSLDCGVGGMIDEKNCQCQCIGNWEVSQTGVCDNCSLSCQHKASKTPNQNCECDCPVSEGWMGKECEICSRKCVHGVLDPVTCKCTCNETYWEGGVTDPTCQICNRRCVNKGPNTQMLDSNCTCINCPYPWTGQWCHICSRSPCQYGSLINATLASGQTQRKSDNTVIQSIDSSKLTCFGSPAQDCSCCCNSLFSSPSEDPRYLTMRFQGDHCENVPSICPLGTKSSAYNLTTLDCKPCQGNWEGRFCDQCNFQCFRGSSNAYCQCDCESGWRHGANTNTGNANGQCNICTPRLVAGPTCAEDENNNIIGFNCHLGSSTRKRSGICGQGSHLCTVPELQRALDSGFSTSVWANFRLPNQVIRVQYTQCFSVQMKHIKNQNWGSAKLHIVDTVTGYVHAVLSHTNGATTTTSEVCLPRGEYRGYVCGGSYGSSVSTSQFSHIDHIDLSGDVRYRVNVGGGNYGAWTGARNTGGVSISSGSGPQGFGSLPSLGNSDFNYVMGSIEWSSYTANQKYVDIHFSVQANSYYQVQLLFGERCCDRGFSIIINDNLVIQNFVSSNPTTSSNNVVNYKFVSTESTIRIRLIGRSDGNKPNKDPILNAVVITKIGVAEMYWSIPDLSTSWIQGSSHVCSSADNYYFNLNSLTTTNLKNYLSTEPRTFPNLDSYFNYDMTELGSLCCSDECTGVKYCDGKSCYPCPTCAAGFYSTCGGNSVGACLACSASACVSGQTYVASKCGKYHNGCVDSVCSQTGCA